MQIAHNRCSSGSVRMHLLTLLLVLVPTIIQAASDSARIVGDLKVDGIHFPDGSVQTKASVWGSGATNGVDIGFLSGKVGIGTLTPSAELEVVGSVKAGQFNGDGSGLSNLKYSKVAVVAVSGANYTSPVAAMTDVAAWCGTPSTTNPCLLKIMPGIYDLGVGVLTMQQYVDVEGSGENVTVISGAVGNASLPLTNGVVNGASNAEIRYLTVKNGATGSYVAGVASSEASPKLTHITVNASGGTTSNFGVYNYKSSPVMIAVTTSASGGNDSYGVCNVSSSSPTMNNVTSSAYGGTYCYGVYNNASSPTMSNFSAFASGGTNSNFGVYNDSASYPSMNNGIASATNGAYSYGIFNTASAPSMSNFAAYASSGTTANFGVYNDSTSSASLNNVYSGASGGTTSYGVCNVSSEPSMSNVNAIGTGASAGNYGLYNYSASGTYKISIDRSSFTGTTSSILNTANFTLLIGASKLAGGAVTAAGTFSCAGVYANDGSVIRILNAACQ